MYVTGFCSASSAARLALVTWIRSASAPNDGMPSAIATTSPSRSMSS